MTFVGFAGTGYLLRYDLLRVLQPIDVHVTYGLEGERGPVPSLVLDNDGSQHGGQGQHAHNGDAEINGWKVLPVPDKMAENSFSVKVSILKKAELEAKDEDKVEQLAQSIEQIIHLLKEEGIL